LLFDPLGTPFYGQIGVFRQRTQIRGLVCTFSLFLLLLHGRSWLLFGPELIEKSTASMLFFWIDISGGNS
jgi:hypothetical protein